MSQRPNIIFILTDDQRADTLGCMGNSIIRTPNIDRMAQEGVLFKNAFVTSAICTPSRVCYLLGQYERKHGINFNSGTSIAPEAWEKSYPKLLSQAGYFTGYVGKNHVPIGEGGYGSGVIEESFDYWYAGHRHLYFYPKRTHEIFSNAKADTQVEIIEEGVMNFLEPNEEFMHKAVRFLETRPEDKPFCLSVCLNVPHDSSSGSMKLLTGDPEIYKTLYRDQIDVIPLPKTYIAKTDITTPKLPKDVLHAQYRQKGYEYVNTSEDMKERLIRVMQTVTGVDRFVGNLREKLTTLNIADNTVIIYASDHGIMYGEHGLGGKALNYEQCLHIPIIIYDPRLMKNRQGKRLDEFVLSIDIAPTILSMAGVEVPETMQGKDLIPVLHGKEVKWRKDAFAENLWSTEFGNPRCESVRTKEWKYIRYFENRVAIKNKNEKERYSVSGEAAIDYENNLTASIRGEQPIYEELFNLSDDPYEEHNMAENAKYQEVLQKMRKRVRELVIEAKDGEGKPLTLLLSSEDKKVIKKLVPED